MTDRVINRGGFKPRLPELRAIEGSYGDIKLSCRHKDILRASITRHFTSCFRPGGLNAHMPKLYCYVPEVCIIFKADRSGQFIGRAFGFLDLVNKELKLGRIYGNELYAHNITNSIGSTIPYRIVETQGDVYFESLDDKL